MQLSRENIQKIKPHEGLQIPNDAVFSLPEKIIQFGTGVLLRGLPNYFINKANNKGIFNGRVVVVKSTTNGAVDAFEQQDGLYTTCIQGIEDGKRIEEIIINASISRVLTAATEWKTILDCAHQPEIEIIFSNTTEVGIVLNEQDKIGDNPPQSFPGKLLAFLLERYKAFEGASDKGMVIVPCELISDNGVKLKSIVLALAKLNQLDNEFIHWLNHSNDFCNSLVDRIVPGNPSEATKNKIQSAFGFTDELMIMSESFRFWAIESSSERVKKILSFTQADEGVVIAANIDKFKEIKLRLLNSVHTFATGISLFTGIDTVKEAMNQKVIADYIQHLSIQEIVPAIISDDISEAEATTFAMKVFDRFRNPFIEHHWSSIAVQYTLKMKSRNVALIEKYYQKTNAVPQKMALGFAVFILYMKSEQIKNSEFYGIYQGIKYQVKDENAAYFSLHWKQHSSDTMVNSILSDEIFWGINLTQFDGFADAVNDYLQMLLSQNIYETLQFNNQKLVVE